jgi:branched-chain amino acid transport system permease protein
MSTVVIQAMSGLTFGLVLFLFAAGLSLVFGVMRVLNFAHGVLFMLGGFLAFAITSAFADSPVKFIIALLTVPFIVAAIGLAVEVLLFRRLYHRLPLDQLLATFALTLIGIDVVRLGWGVSIKSLDKPAFAAASVEVLGQSFPSYYFLIWAVSASLGLLLWLLIYKTRAGMILRTVVQDRDMASALGINTGRIFTYTFALGAWLAGLAGVLIAPLRALSVELGTESILEAFIAVVIGGLGSILGTLIGALAMGALQSFGILWQPRFATIIPFLLMAIILILRPYGLFGKREVVHGAGHQAIALESVMLRPLFQTWASRLRNTALAITLLVAILLPSVAPRFQVTMAIEAIYLSLWAVSMFVLMAQIGMVSFGHAAFFGLGAYTVALGIERAGLPFGVSFVLAPLIGGVAAGIVGFFCLRLRHPIYFAMLTLAFAQIIYTVVFQWYDFTRGDNGLVGFGDRIPETLRMNYDVLYYFVLGVGVLALMAVRLVLSSPFGITMRLVRDDPERAESLGVPVQMVRLWAFVLAGVLAALAGALMATFQRAVFPDTLHWVRSGEVLIMVLLGGMTTIWGPVVGATVFLLLNHYVTQWTTYWQLTLGLVLLALLLVFRLGITGIASSFSMALEGLRLPLLRPAAAIVNARSSTVGSASDEGVGGTGTDKEI